MTQITIPFSHLENLPCYFENRDRLSPGDSSARNGRSNEHGQHTSQKVKEDGDSASYNNWDENAYQYFDVTFAHKYLVTKSMDV